MTRRQRFVEDWLFYALALLPLVLLDGLVLGRVSFYGARPHLLPLAVILVAIWEGATAGAAYGLYAGFFASLLGHGTKGSFLFLLSLLGLGVGYLYRKGMERDFFGCFLGAMASLFALNLLRMAYYSSQYGAAFFSLFAIAVPELLWSMVFFPLVYGLYKLAQRGAGGRALA